ncbi:hypothetical protein XENOCAPTIV_007910, partial [Xenoophorus captivus]
VPSPLVCAWLLPSSAGNPGRDRAGKHIVSPVAEQQSVKRRTFLAEGEALRLCPYRGHRRPMVPGTLVLLLSRMLGPLQDRNMLQESSSKFRLLYPTLNPIWAILKGADNTAV